jgi:hypothetical protein
MRGLVQIVNIECIVIIFLQAEVELQLYLTVDELARYATKRNGTSDFKVENKTLSGMAQSERDIPSLRKFSNR